MFENLFNKCPHEYKQVGFIPCTTLGEDGICDVPCYFLECKHCGKRKVLRESDYAYTDAFLDMIDLWTKGQYKINFKEYQNETVSCESGGSSNELYFETVLRGIQDEVKRFNLPMHDSENKLVVNNIKELINSALKEGSTDEETK